MFVQKFCDYHCTAFRSKLDKNKKFRTLGVISSMRVIAFYATFAISAALKINDLPFQIAPKTRYFEDCAII